MIQRLIALASGLVLGFFVVLNLAFSDVFTWQDRLLSILLIYLTYGLPGFLLGLWEPRRFVSTGLLLSIPAVMFLVALMISEGTGALLWGSLYALITLDAAFAAAWAGSRIRRRRQEKAEQRTDAIRQSEQHD